MSAQGPVLGPILFILSTSPLGDRQCGLSYHFYADNTQLYISFNLSRVPQKMKRCVDLIRGWMANNFLKLNKEKTCSLPILTQLHWMAIVEWIHYKLFPSYRQGPLRKGPSVHQGALHISSQPRLHHFNDKMLVCPHTHTVRHADRSFKIAAPTLLNQLPEHLH